MIIMHNMNRSMFVSLFEQIVVEIASISIDITIQSLEVRRGKGISHVVRNRHIGNIGSIQPVLVDEHLFNGRFTTPIFDISKLIGQG